MTVLKPAFLDGSDATRGGISSSAKWVTVTSVVRRDPNGVHSIRAVPATLATHTPNDDQPAVWLVIWDTAHGDIENVFLVPAGDQPGHHVGRFMAGGNYAAFEVSRREWTAIDPDIGEAVRIHDRT